MRKLWQQCELCRRRNASTGATFIEFVRITFGPVRNAFQRTKNKNKSFAENLFLRIESVGGWFGGCIPTGFQCSTRPPCIRSGWMACIIRWLDSFLLGLHDLFEIKSMPIRLHNKNYDSASVSVCVWRAGAIGEGERMIYGMSASRKIIQVFEIDFRKCISRRTEGKKRKTMRQWRIETKQQPLPASVQFEISMINGMFSSASTTSSARSVHLVLVDGANSSSSSTWMPQSPRLSFDRIVHTKD